MDVKQQSTSLHVSNQKTIIIAISHYFQYPPLSPLSFHYPHYNGHMSVSHLSLAVRTEGVSSETGRPHLYNVLSLEVRVLGAPHQVHVVTTCMGEGG